MSFEDEYRELMEKPIEEIKEDIFFRMDNFQHEPWYGEFELFLAAGVCQPPEEQALQVRKALKVVGYDTHTVSRGGRTYILPGEARQTARSRSQKSMMTGSDNHRHRGRSRSCAGFIYSKTGCRRAAWRHGRKR